MGSHCWIHGIFQFAAMWHIGYRFRLDCVDRRVAIVRVARIICSEANRVCIARVCRNIDSRGLPAVIIVRIECIGEFTAAGHGRDELKLDIVRKRA